MRKCVNRAMVPCRWCGKTPPAKPGHAPEVLWRARRGAHREARETEKTRDVANEKAMRTLRIKKGDAKDLVEPMRRPEPASGAPRTQERPPTPGNFYRELMTKPGDRRCPCTTAR